MHDTNRSLQGFLARHRSWLQRGAHTAQAVCYPLALSTRQLFLSRVSNACYVKIADSCHKILVISSKTKWLFLAIEIPSLLSAMYFLQRHIQSWPPGCAQSLPWNTEFSKVLSVTLWFSMGCKTSSLVASYAVASSSPPRTALYSDNIR